MTNELSNRDYLILRAYQSGIHESRELAAFMGQMEIESAGFARMHENLNYSGKRLLQVFPGRNGLDSLVEAHAIASGGPEVVSNAIYGGEWGRDNLGNTELGDGWRFHGRGYVQLTGRDNYLRDGRETGLDLTGNPELAADRGNAATIALHYWQSRVVQRNHQYNVREATHDINGGYNHLPERRTAISRWERMLTQSVMEHLSRGEVVLPSTYRSEERALAARALQHNLNTLGAFDNENRPLVVDGNLGQRTSQAIASFQRQHSLPDTGTADLLTLAAIDVGVRAVESVNAVKQFGQEFLPPGYRTDWLEHDSRGLPDYLLSDRNVPNQAPAPPIPQTATPTMHASPSPPLRSGPALTPPHHYTSPSPAEPAALPPLPTLQTLEPGDRSAAVQALQQHLLLLGATDRYGKEISADKEYGDRTREAVEQFQLWTGREPTGIADPDTLKAVQSQAQFALRQRGQGITIVPDAHLADHLRPIVPERVDAAIERPVQARGQAGLTPFSDPQHPQHALYADVQQRFQAKGHDLSEAQLSTLTGHMHTSGYKPAWEGDVIVYQGQAVVGATQLGIRQTSLDLNVQAPSVQETMQTFQTDQQNLAQSMEALRQQQAMAHGHSLSH